MSIIDETQEEDVTAEQDEQMPQLFSQASSLHHNDAVTLKNPKVLATEEHTSDSQQQQKRSGLTMVLRRRRTRVHITLVDQKTAM